jgi:hypothetical protein
VLDVLGLARNVGEVLGVFGDYTFPDRPPIVNTGYPSTVEISNLRRLENLLKTLWSPQWPDAFPKIDQAAAAKGAVLYKANLDGKESCLSCHELIDRKDPNRSVKKIMSATGTDSRMWDNFFVPNRPTGKLEGSLLQLIPPKKMPANIDGATFLAFAVKNVILGGWKEAPPDQLEKVNFSGNREVAAVRAVQRIEYRARPLNGIWATAPYLHNGSVPNLDALLRKTDDRPKSFSVGVRTYDPVRVGYKTDVPGFPKYHVVTEDNKPVLGHSNKGHEYGTTLSDEERRQLIEYLKTL